MFFYVLLYINIDIFISFHKFRTQVMIPFVLGIRS